MAGTVKTVVGYEKKPPQCVGECPVDDACANRAGMLFKPDCPGPSVIDSPEPVKGKLDMDGTDATYDPTFEMTAPIGEIACRGAMDWAKARQGSASQP